MCFCLLKKCISLLRLIASVSYKKPNYLIECQECRRHETLPEHSCCCLFPPAHCLVIFPLSRLGVRLAGSVLRLRFFFSPAPPPARPPPLAILLSFFFKDMDIHNAQRSCRRRRQHESVPLLSSSARWAGVVHGIAYLVCFITWSPICFVCGCFHQHKTSCFLLSAGSHYVVLDPLPSLPFPPSLPPSFRIFRKCL